MGTSPGPPPMPVALSTASVFPERTPDAFETAARLGYDGIEVMVTRRTRSARTPRCSASCPTITGSLSSPCTRPNLLITQRVWGREPWRKLVRSRELAETLGAKVVVVHPAFRWQREYARDFEERHRRGCGQETDVAFAVENLYPLRARGDRDRRVRAALEPGGDGLRARHPGRLACGGVRLGRAGHGRALGDRLAHVHLADGTKPGLPDEHLVPGRGTQPCAELLRWLVGAGYGGLVVLEVSTHRVADPRRPPGRPGRVARRSPAAPEAIGRGRGAAAASRRRGARLKISVTGPSLTSSTCMCAPNTPV